MVDHVYDIVLETEAMYMSVLALLRWRGVNAGDDHIHVADCTAVPKSCALQMSVKHYLSRSKRCGRYINLEAQTKWLPSQL